MPKKPFSNKQKKKQLQGKKNKKRGGEVKEQEGEKDDSHGGYENEASTTEQLSKQEQGRNSNWRKVQPKRYNLQFNEEKQQEIEDRKRKATEPFVLVPKERMEMSFEMMQSDVQEIPIPRRPSWSYEMSKEQVEKQEAKMFKEYVSELYAKYDNDKLSYFEHNLETWRQLWRVLELSDIVIIIADTRHPILHFPMALWRYINDDLKKGVILALNKIDIVAPELVVAWKYYFKEKFPDLKVVTFTSFPKDPELVKPRPGKVLQKRRRRKGGYVAVGQRGLLDACRDLCPNKDLSDWDSLISEQESRKTHQDDGYGGSSDEDDIQVQDLAAAAVAAEEDEELLTLGLIGHPNVGKSTFLNGLYGRKVVSTSRTPGHTKYFQTIFLTSKVRLCDCPGLVFPAYIEKQLQILSGMYPIAQVREPYTSVGYLASRIPLIELLKLTHPSLEDEDYVNPAEIKWSAWDICTAWATKRGFLTAKVGRPDVYRAANDILRLAVDGRLCLSVYPPNFIKDEEKWKRHRETATIAKLLKNFSGVKVSTETWSDDSEQESQQGSSGEDEDSSGDKQEFPSVANKFAALSMDD